MVDKKDRPAKELTRELHQAVIGIPDNPEENGLIGDIKDIKKEFKILNGRVTKTETGLSRLKGIIAGISILGGLGGIILSIIVIVT